MNVSPEQVTSHATVGRLASTIEDHALVNPCDLKLEVTEQVQLKDPAAASAGLTRLKSTDA